MTSPAESLKPDPDLPARAELVVIGGGVMGASLAYHLAAGGMQGIVLLEKERLLGQGATGRCAGGVRFQFGTEVNIRLSLASLPMLARFAEEIGQDVSFRRCGYLFVLTRPADVQTFRQQVELQHRLGVATEWWEAGEVQRRLSAARFEDALGATFHGLDGLVDPHSVVLGYTRAAQRLGVRVVTSAPVQAIAVRSGRVQGLETPRGSISCPAVVNAAGPWAGEVGKLAGIDLPIRPVRRQIFTTSPLPEIGADFPFVIDFAQSLYFHREAGGLLVGMSNPAQAAGFNQNVDEAFELRTLEAAVRRLPLLERAGRASHWAGLYEVTPDAHPIFGGTPVEGFSVVSGFSGHGFMHGPIAGKLMAEWILEGAFKSVDVSMLDLARFQEGRQIQEYNVV